MGFLKKITRPISRVLDKIVPNEIKPALPFLAAAAPFMAPGIMGAFGNSMLSRGLISGGLNLGSQLAQEGSDGDFSGLSTLMAAATGALSTPRGTDFSMSGPGEGPMTSPSAADFFKNKAAGMEPGFAKSGLGALEGTSNYLTGVGETLRTNPFSMEGLKAGLVPIGQGTTDLAIAEARRAQKDYERDMADAEAEQGASDAQRAAAIRQSMEAYGFTEEEIEDAIYAAGYKAGGRVGLSMGGGADFGGIPAAIQNIKEDEEETITIMTDNGPMEIQKSVYESMPGMFMDTTTSAYGDAGRGRPVPQFANGGRIGFKDGSSTGNFGADRYASELVEAYKGILDKGDMFYTDVEKELIEKGEYPSQDQMKEFQDRYENLEKEYEKEEDKFGNVGLQDSLLDKDAIKYYNKKVKDLEDREEKLMDKEEKLNEVMYTDLDVSGILKTPEFQEWYTLWKAKDPKADDLPGAEYFENMMFDTKRLRPDVMKTKYNVEMKDGGLMNLGGREMDMRGGGFIPIGKKERADDVPARLSKNEFVMTADAVRAAGGGSVNKGAKRMYDLMNNLEARV
jgi:hypothetical protein